MTVTGCQLWCFITLCNFERPLAVGFALLGLLTEVDVVFSAWLLRHFGVFLFWCDGGSRDGGRLDGMYRHVTCPVVYHKLVSLLDGLPGVGS